MKYRKKFMKNNFIIILSLKQYIILQNAYENVVFIFTKQKTKNTPFKVQNIVSRQLPPPSHYLALQNNNLHSVISLCVLRVTITFGFHSRVQSKQLQGWAKIPPR